MFRPLCLPIVEYIHSHCQCVLSDNTLYVWAWNHDVKFLSLELL